MSEEKRKDIEEIQLSENTQAKLNRKEGIVRIVTKGERTAKDNLGMLEAFSDQNKIPIFKGTIAHAYESDYLGFKDHCPKCNTPTEQMMSNFAYGTQEDSRILTAPAGHFCSACPTVIIDDDVMKSAIDKNFKYGGVFEIESGYEEKKKLLETLNGEKPIFILNEYKDKVYGIAQSVHQSSEDYTSLVKVSSIAKKQIARKQQKAKSNNKRKNKAAKKARKKNKRR